MEKTLQNFWGHIFLKQSCVEYKKIVWCIKNIYESIQEIYKDANVTSWATFDERLRDRHMSILMKMLGEWVRNPFIDWVEQQSVNDMGPNELLREIEKK